MLHVVYMFAESTALSIANCLCEIVFHLLAVQRLYKAMLYRMTADSITTNSAAECHVYLIIALLRTSH